MDTLNINPWEKPPWHWFEDNNSNPEIKQLTEEEIKSNKEIFNKKQDNYKKVCSYVSVLESQTKKEDEKELCLIEDGFNWNIDLDIVYEKLFLVESQDNKVTKPINEFSKDKTLSLNDYKDILSESLEETEVIWVVLAFLLPQDILDMIPNIKAMRKVNNIDELKAVMKKIDDFIELVQNKIKNRTDKFQSFNSNAKQSFNKMIDNYVNDIESKKSKDVVDGFINWMSKNNTFSKNNKIEDIKWVEKEFKDVVRLKEYKKELIQKEKKFKEDIEFDEMMQKGTIPMTYFQDEIKDLVWTNTRRIVTDEKFKDILDKTVQKFDKYEDYLKKYWNAMRKNPEFLEKQRVEFTNDVIRHSLNNHYKNKRNKIPEKYNRYLNP